jgi:hypothetical protein
MGPSAHLPDLRPCRLLRRFPETPCDRALSRDRHPIIEGYDPPEGWSWCYPDAFAFDLGDDTTPQLGPIPRYV